MSGEVFSSSCENPRDFLEYDAPLPWDGSILFTRYAIAREGALGMQQILKIF